MRFSTTFIALAAPYLVSAAPARIYGKRAAADIVVLKFADVLEQLETTFYQQAIQKFQDSDFTSAGFSSAQIPIEQFINIQKDESTHSQVLQAALKSFGESPITSCKFKFDSVLTDVATMAATARVVENVGVGAYLGGATLITDPVILDAAGSILTVEARHQTILNVLSGSGTAIPSAFDIPLTPSEVLALAGPFFDGPCDVGLPANPSLAITNTGTPAPGTLLTFSSSAINGSTDNFHCQMMIGGASSSIALPLDQCIVPEGINGPVAIWVTSDGQPLTNNVRDRATTQLVAGPTMAFIDTQPETLGQMARAGSNGARQQQGSSSTQTISPAQASSIIASAGAATDAPGASPTAPAGSPQGAPAAQGAPPSQGAPVANAASAPVAPGTPGGPNTFTGPSPDGSVTVNGWTNIPAQ
ncbi:hypothetical protein BDN72DRAFT_833275 [Pluteus cervinus]|uniref:Uncharacterized protein n=1 Tax=Pluteus cervinus TaxID=181527 RepID=A0ACD3B7S4_9AGAR|nr:hypothetical protein BDN72DRAFT_833275 [Pluteus cervinus]